MEERKVTISRLRSKVEYPASFMLVAATNPCPCGYYGEGDRCRCSPGKRISYISKLSGPLMDRIDIHLWLHPADPSKLARMEKEECSKKIAERVYAAREIQRNRFTGSGIFTNAEMTGKMTLQYCRLSPQCTTFLEKAIDKMGLSARAGIRILKIARTIADLAGEDEISIGHLAEATGYRFLDRI